MNKDTATLEYLKRLTGGTGYAEFSDANAHVINASTILILEDDTTIASLKIDNGGVVRDVIATANADTKYNLASANLLKNTIISCGVNERFTSITLTDGKVGVYYI